MTWNINCFGIDHDAIITDALEYARRHSNKTSNCSRYYPRLRCWHAPFLKFGNNKIEGAYVFNKSAVRACPYHKKCKGCYGKNDERHENVRLVHAFTTFLALYDIPYLEAEICIQLARSRKYDATRINGDGDFVSQEEVDMWDRIARWYPMVKFWYYTKTSSILDFSRLSGRDNVNQLESILPDGEINYGVHTYIIDMMKKYRDILDIVVCPYKDPMRKGQPELKCVSQCNYCLHHKYVLIHKH